MYYEGICMKKNGPADENEVEGWGSYMAAKKAKLEDQYRDLVGKEFQNATDLFKGIAIFVNGWTNPCADELRRLMMQHGGVYHIYQRSGSTTHLIASNLPNTKILQYLKSKNPLPLCKPEWITDSIKANKLLDWKSYLLYSSASITQPQLQFNTRINPPPGVMQDKKIPFDPGPSTSSALHSAVTKETSNPTKNDAKSPSHAKESKSNGVALCSKNDEFLTEFYNNSRLHHISTMSATFKEYVNQLRSKNTESFPGLERLKQSRKHLENRAATFGNNSDSEDDIFNTPDSCDKVNGRSPIIMHIDMDCFFVSVGLKNKPELRGLPVAVTHARGNKPSTNSNENEEEFLSMAEIASCSYEARKAGLKNGMFLGQALKLCPNLRTIKYDFEGYKEVSYILYDTIASYTLDIEAVSCDELYADVSTTLQQCNLTPLEFAKIVRDEIKEKTGCPVSTGFGSNKLQARLATKHAKPDGQFHLKDVDVQSYIGGMSVRDIPGVGYTTMNQLKKMNVRLCSDLRGISLDSLQKEFGKKTGEMLHNTCRGIDLSKLNIEHVRKSVSSEVNYGIRFENDNDAKSFLEKLSKEVVSRLTKINAKGKCLTLKLMVRAKDAPVEPAKFMGHGLCDNFTKSRNFMTQIDDETIITKEVLSLWEQMQQPAHEIRGIGIQISRLETLKKQPDTYMMKFFSKAKQPMPDTSDTINKVVKTTMKPIKNPQLSEINNDNRRGSGKKVSKALKPQGLEAFFTAKKSAVLPRKTPEEFDNCPSHMDINESVLAELPDDIKMELANFQRGKPKGKVQGPKQCSDLEKCDEKPFLLTQDIDEAVFNELPLDIRNEILAYKSSKNETKKAAPKKASQTEHLRPERYFKHAKPGKCNKVELPNIEQLDMKVLVELPDDIRNEILNHYKTKQKGEVENTNATHELNIESYNTAIHDRNIQMKGSRHIADEFNVSFSQIDPDFLSALSDDIKDDVKMYCMAKKKEAVTKSKKSLNELMGSIAVPVKEHNVTSIKKRGRKTKASLNNVLSKSKPITKTKVRVNNNIEMKNHNDNQIVGRSRSFLENEINILQDDNVVVNDRRDDIRSHQSSFSGNTANSDEHQEMLTNLVNHLFTLPMRQVRNQIETWISKCNQVNEIDVISLATFLSMLPKERRIEDLHVLMRTMHRCMTEIGSCIWHETYSRTVEHVQHYMQLEYNSNLMLPPIRCNLRECKSNRV